MQEFIKKLYWEKKANKNWIISTVFLLFPTFYDFLNKNAASKV